MNADHPGFRIFVLGSGFSHLAGLPLGQDLFTTVRRRIRNGQGGGQFQRDLENYLKYRKCCDGEDLRESDVNLEEFMSFLDLEHYLGLRGSDTWSQAGNETQLIIRRTIGEVIHSRTPPADCISETYYRFADRLSLKDIVITFNYDILLERALEHVGNPYRLFPWRYKKIGNSFHEVDSDVKEVTLLKLHGSVDWFDDRDFLDRREEFRAFGLPNEPKHSVFSEPDHYSVEPLAQGQRPPNDPLLHIHRIRNVDYYYRGDFCLDAPFILAPSNVKFVYAQPLLDLWRGWRRAGGLNLGISVIGFSLPKHDDYVRIMLYQMINNYQQCWWGEKRLGVLKDNVKLVDYRGSDKDIAEYKERYSFVDSARARYMFGGFNHEAIQFIFDQTRNT